jgi:hypothetical protein
MSKSMITLGAALAIVSLASLAPAQAGGGATSASSRYSHTAQVQNQNHPAHTADVGITEFSSSSAKSSAPKR